MGRARRDALTGLYNRMKFDEVIVQKSFGRDTDTTFRYGGEELIVIGAVQPRRR